MSRRAAEECIKVGRESTAAAKFFGMSADTETGIYWWTADRPTAGEKLYISSISSKGYVTTLHDEKDRRCVTELLSGRMRVYLCRAARHVFGRAADMHERRRVLPTGSCTRRTRWRSATSPGQGEDVGEAVEYLRYPMEIDGYMTRGAEVDIISLLPGGAELA